MSDYLYTHPYVLIGRALMLLYSSFEWSNGWSTGYRYIAWRDARHMDTLGQVDHPQMQKILRSGCWKVSGSRDKRGQFLVQFRYSAWCKFISAMSTHLPPSLLSPSCLPLASLPHNLHSATRTPSTPAGDNNKPITRSLTSVATTVFGGTSV